MRITFIQPLEDLSVVNYIEFCVLTLALEGIYHGEKCDIFWKW